MALAQQQTHDADIAVKRFGVPIPEVGLTLNRLDDNLDVHFGINTDDFDVELDMTIPAEADLEGLAPVFSISKTVEAGQLKTLGSHWGIGARPKRRAYAVQSAAGPSPGARRSIPAPDDPPRCARTPPTWEHRAGLVEGFIQQYGLTRLVFAEHYDDMRAARQRERNMKHWRRGWKVRLILDQNPDWDDLYDRLP